MLVLTYLDSVMDEFVSFFYFYQSRSCSKSKIGSKLNQKCEDWVSPVSVKI